MPFLRLLVSLILQRTCSNTDIPIYPGSGDVELVPQASWSLKYPLHRSCIAEFTEWCQKLIIDITATTTEADLIYAFGTQQEYFGVGHAWDNWLCVPLRGPCRSVDPNPDACTSHCASLFVTPSTGQSLQVATTSLEAQYESGLDFRCSLCCETDCTYANMVDRWARIADDGVKDAPMGINAAQMNLTICSYGGETHLTVDKNGASASITMGSTWQYDPNALAFLYFGIDAIHGENFVLSGITETSCGQYQYPTAEPTTDAPTRATPSPTDDPTAMPTNLPTSSPTINVDACDWNCYKTSYADEIGGYSAEQAEMHYLNYGYWNRYNCACYPTPDPTRNPTEVPTSSTGTPTGAPSDAPTADPTSEPTLEPTISTLSPTNTPSDADDDQDENDDDQGENATEDDSAPAESASLIKGVSNTILFGAAGGVALLILVVGIACLLWHKKVKGKLSVSDGEYDDW